MVSVEALWGHWLDGEAAQHGLKRNAGEKDYTLRFRIRLAREGAVYPSFERGTEVSPGYVIA
jgi:hypothetical protein